MALLGPSGTGKSVLLKHIIGLIHPDRGTIIVDDKDVGRLKRKELAELRSHIGYVFQNGALFDSDDVFENVRLGHHRRQTSTATSSYARTRVAECIKLVNLPPETVDKFPAAALGRHAEARGHRPGHRGQPQVSALRRAHLRARSGQRRRDRRAGPEPGRDARRHRRHGDARRAGRLSHRRPAGAAHRRQDRAAGHAEGVSGVQGSARCRSFSSATSTTPPSQPEPIMDLALQAGSHRRDASSSSPSCCSSPARPG